MGLSTMMTIRALRPLRRPPWVRILLARSASGEFVVQAVEATASDAVGAGDLLADDLDGLRLAVLPFQPVGFAKDFPGRRQGAKGQLQGAHRRVQRIKNNHRQSLPRPWLTHPFMAGGLRRFFPVTKGRAACLRRAGDDSPDMTSFHLAPTRHLQPRLSS